MICFFTIQLPLVCWFLFGSAHAFICSCLRPTTGRDSIISLYVNGDNVKANGDNTATYATTPMQQSIVIHDEVDTTKRIEKLKRELLQLGASFDRGFSASPKARKLADILIKDLETLNPEENASKGIDGYEGNFDDSPLSGAWSMVWCSAEDVLILGANPAVSSKCDLSSLYASDSDQCYRFPAPIPKFSPYKPSILFTASGKGTNTGFVPRRRTERDRIGI
jgi:hypothetical protein